MKTISLNDKAYEKLLSWKTGPKDSFSKVVDRVVPARGSLGAIAHAAESLPPLTDEQVKVIHRGLKELDDWSKQRDPWTS
jgi:predicted CopG family antitoxin